MRLNFRKESLVRLTREINGLSPAWIAAGSSRIYLSGNSSFGFSLVWAVHRGAPAAGRAWGASVPFLRQGIVPGLQGKSGNCAWIPRGSRELCLDSKDNQGIVPGFPGHCAGLPVQVLSPALLAPRLT